MKTQERRDEEAVTIFAGLLLFLFVTAAGAVVLVIVHQLVPLKGDLLNLLVYVVLSTAALMSIRYIYRNRDRCGQTDLPQIACAADVRRTSVTRSGA